MRHKLETMLGRPAPWIMGVLNVTPDSFTDGGRFEAAATAIAHARKMHEDGAQIVDIGGESTAPGSRPVDQAIEQRRILPVVEALAGEMALSIDTYRAATADACLQRGALIVNDVSALRADPEMPAVVRAHDAVLVMMHAKDGPLPHASDSPRIYEDVVGEIGDFLAARIDVAMGHGIAQDRLVVDPGWGRFISLDPADSWHLLEGFERLIERLRPVPLMVATSRKGFLGVPMDDRDPLSQLTSLIAVQRGAALIRTHAPRMAAQFLEVASRAGIGGARQFTRQR